MAATMHATKQHGVGLLAGCYADAGAGADADADADANRDRQRQAETDRPRRRQAYRPRDSKNLRLDKRLRPRRNNPCDHAHTETTHTHTRTHTHTHAHTQATHMFQEHAQRTARETFGCTLAPRALLQRGSIHATLDGIGFKGQINAYMLALRRIQCERAGRSSQCEIV